ncbi:putative Radical SAM domain iron-sulfur cluster-binding oxidoreductase [uncultured Desulfobacterium sp.]|uniref:Putative Radical SAM domain iron-sulfur cluster-binding oxidoreductase n=1 Tax=uncultured Desulfobacterium sp. TaxID=201089 RepID=A0A445MWS9_9BACT|nr:putative Radical SAM domain iron-sulfur cluster-binding oxidoreductase [uncultured Desulfobacterium sp.]
MNLNNLKIPKIVSDELLKITANASNGNLIKALNILEKFASIKWHFRGFEFLRRMIEEDHPGIQATRRILKNANPAARSAIMNNLILGCLLLGYRKRLEFYNKHGVAPPGTLMISPTMRCNLNCYGCYAGTHDKTDELTFDEVDRILTQASDAGTNFIILLGGEPFMVPWLLDMIERHPSLAFQVYTNGLLIDDEKVERLSRLGNAAISVSVDGFEDETDRRRGKGTYAKATALMRRLNEAGVIVGFSAMLSRRNFDTIYSDKFLDEMIACGAGYGWIPLALPQGRACVEPELILTEEQKKQIYDMVKKARFRKPILLLDFYNDARITEGCSAGRITMHINANGDVEPCVLMPFSKDNIRKKSMVDILRSDFFEGLRDINRRYCNETQTCLWVFKPKDVLDVINTCGVRPTSEGVLDRLHELAAKQQ